MSVLSKFALVGRQEKTGPGGNECPFNFHIPEDDEGGSRSNIGIRNIAKLYTCNSSFGQNVIFP